MNNISFGKVGEQIATNYLKKKGYKIVANNYKNTLGEIDIIAMDKGVFVFVEVKTRVSRAFGDPLEAINYHKQNKIRQVATKYLKDNKKLDYPCRFDAISVLGSEDSEINHIIDAF